MKMTKDNFEYDIKVNVRAEFGRLFINTGVHCEDTDLSSRLTSFNVLNSLVSAIMVTIKSQDLKTQGEYYQFILDRLENEFLSTEEWEDSNEIKIKKRNK